MGDMVGTCQHGGTPAYCPLCLADKIEAATYVREVGQIISGAEGVVVAALRAYAEHSRSEADRSDWRSAVTLAGLTPEKVSELWQAAMFESAANFRGYIDKGLLPNFKQEATLPQRFVIKLVCHLLDCSTSTQIMTRETYDALKFAAEHFEGYGLSHLQHGHSWTGVGIAAVLRLLIPDGK